MTVEITILGKHERIIGEDPADVLLAPLLPPETLDEIARRAGQVETVWDVALTNTGTHEIVIEQFVADDENELRELVKRASAHGRAL